MSFTRRVRSYQTRGCAELKLLMTGASGHFGSLVLPLLKKRYDRILVLGRTPVEGVEFARVDLSMPDLGLNVEDLNLFTEFTSDSYDVFHGASFYQIDGGKTQCHLNNVVGLNNLIFRLDLDKVDRFYHISSVAVARNFNGHVPYDHSFPMGENLDAYAESKYAQETILFQSMPKEKLCLFRLGILTGDTYTGVHQKIDGVLMLIRSLVELKERLPFLLHAPVLPLPYSEETVLPVIGSDVAAICVDNIMSKADRLRQVYHLVDPEAPTMGQLLSDIFKYLNYKTSPVPIPKIKYLSSVVKQIGLPVELVDYGYSKALFEDPLVEKYYQDLGLNCYHQYKTKMFDFVVQGLE